MGITRNLKNVINMFDSNIYFLHRKKRGQTFHGPSTEVLCELQEMISWKAFFFFQNSVCKSQSQAMPQFKSGLFQALFDALHDWSAALRRRDRCLSGNNQLGLVHH